METAYLLTIFLTFFSFAATFLLLARKNSSQFLYCFALAWLFEGARTGILLADASGFVLSENWFYLLDILYVPVTLFLMLAVYSFLGVKDYQLRVGIYFILTIIGFLLAVTLGPDILAYFLNGDEAKVGFWLTFTLVTLLQGPGGIIRAILGARFLIHWSNSRMEGAFVAGIFFLIHAAGSLRVPVQWLYSYQSDASNILWFLEILGLSVASIVLVLNREREERESAVRAQAQSERRLSGLVDNLHGIAYRSLADSHLTVTYMNGVCQALTGYPANDFIQNRLRPFRDLVHPQDRSRVESAIRHSLDRKQPFDVTYRVLTASGEVRYFLERGAAVEAEEGGPLAFEGYITDVSELHESQRTVAEANSKLSASLLEVEKFSRELQLLLDLVEALQVCETAAEVCAIGRRYGVELFSDSSGCLFIRTDDGTLLEPLSSWNDPVFKTRTFSPESCWAARRGNLLVSHHAEASLCEHHRSAAPDETHLCVPIDAHGEILGVLHLEFPPTVALEGRAQETALEKLCTAFADQIALALSSLKLRHRLQTEAIRDPLTGLYNRRFLQEALERELSRAVRRDSTGGIILLDLDDFKKVNDTYGHKTGDIVLVELASFLQRGVRAGDIVCRYGGEEFLVILPDTPTDECLSTAERIRLDLSRLKFSCLDTFLTVSIGVSTYPACGASASELISLTDELLYTAKDLGRNRVVCAPQIAPPTGRAES